MESNDPVAQAILKQTGAVLSEQEVIAYSNAAPQEEEETTVDAPESTEAVEVDDETVQFNTLFEKKTGKKYDEVKSVFERKAFEDEVAERLGKPYSEVEEVVKAPKLTARELRSEYSKQLEDWIEKGGVEKDFHNIQRANWEEMSHEDLIKADLKAKYPNADNKKIDILFKSEYKIPKALDPDTYSEEEVAERNDEIEAAMTRMEIRADDVRATKIAQRVKMLEAPVKQELTPEQIETNKKFQEQAQKNYKKVQEEFSNYKNFSLSVTERDSNNREVVSNLSFEPSAEQRETIAKILNDPSSFVGLFIDKDGNINSKDFVDSVTLAVVGKAATAEMAKDLKHEGKKEFIKKELKNADFKTAESVPTPTAQAKRNKELAHKIMMGG